MNPLKFIRRKLKIQNSHDFIGAPSFRYVNPGFYSHYKSEEYASSYPSVRAIANEYMTVRPFAMDGNGKPLQNNAIVNALFHPNQTDSSVAFFEKVAVSTLFHRKTYLLVWRRDGSEAKPGGDFGVRGANIAGFTFLECPSIERRDGRTYYSVGSQEFSDKEVIVLPGGVNPHDLYGGYSPSEASRRWTKLDDYIADFQSGFFENNAIPAGTFIVTAPTVKEYNDIVDMLQSRHKGAGNNNNVTYSHRPVDPNSGKPAQAQIEWVPYQQSNKDIDFKNLFDQTNRRIDVAYGVPAIVKGVDDAATYANAQVSEATFAKRAVYPLLLRNYTQITHELNRITGGIGVAITFDYEIPAVADEEKVVAETTSIQFTTLKAAIDAGFTLDSAVDALKFPANFKLFKSGEQATATIENDKPDVDEGDEVDDSPDPEKIDGVTPLNRPRNPKAQLTDADTEAYRVQLDAIIRDHMQRDIDRAVAELDEPQDAVDTQTEEFTDEMLVVIVSTMQAAGVLQWDEGLALLIAAGVDIGNTTVFNVSDAQKDAYRDYLVNVAESYRDDTAISIRAVLDRANVEGWNRNEMISELENIMNTDDYRVKRLSRSEINRSQQMGNVHSMEQMADEAEVQMEKVWTVTSTEPCPICVSLDGTVKPVGETFLGEGESLDIGDGETFVNTFVTMQTAQAHPNDNCVITYRVKP